MSPWPAETWRELGLLLKTSRSRCVTRIGPQVRESPFSFPLADGEKFTQPIAHPLGYSVHLRDTVFTKAKIVLFVTTH